MARITVTIEPRHADNSPCAHIVKPPGRPRDPQSGCTGRTAYAVVCSEHGDVDDPHHVKALAEPAAVAHRQQHHIDRPPVPRKHPRPDCPFCAIAHDDAPATLIAEWADAIAIVPNGGCTEGHLLVIPRAHVADFTTDPTVSALTMQRASELAAELEGQWNLITSCGKAASQSVFHLHLHLVPRAADDGLTLPWTHPTREQEPAR